MKKVLRIAAVVLVIALFVGTFVFLWLQGRAKPDEYQEFVVKTTDLRKTTIITGKIVRRSRASSPISIRRPVRPLQRVRSSPR